MSIKAEFDQAAIDIFDSFADVVLSGTYAVISTAYVAGGSSNVSETVHNIRLIVEDITFDELQAIGDGGADSKLSKVLIIQSELTAAGVATPTPKDQITFDGKKNTVIQFDTDPAKAIWTFYLREQ